MKRLLILGCSATKDPSPEPMHYLDRYTGQFFKVLKKVPRDQWPDEVIVLSAQHGWLIGDNRIFDYDQRMDRSKAEELIETDSQYDLIGNFIHEKFGSSMTDVFICAGMEYRQVIDNFINELPPGEYTTARGGIGDMSKQLKDWLREGEK